ncbi:MAG: SRPBCC family protein [Chloroflexota bacterium]|jgi:uncharacterized protein YndB with AHSA1/START domain
MYELEASVFIKRPIEDVFAFVADNENDPEWCVPVADTTRIAGDEPGKGTRYTFGADLGLFKPRGELEIVEFQPPHRIAWQGFSRFARFKGYYTLQEADQGTRLSIHSRFSNKPLYRLMEGTMRKAMAENYGRQFVALKALLENHNTA